MPKLQLGLIVGLSENVQESFTLLKQVGVPTCHLACWNPSILTQDLARKVVSAQESIGVMPSTVWAGHSGKTEWNFLKGPATIGLVPPATRAARLVELKQGADFATWIGAPSITTHVGFIPEDPNDLNYAPLIDTLKELAKYCQARNLKFMFETGQETPVTLLRTIEDIGTENLGINLDPANLILYGKANPVDALDVFGKYVIGMHAKDGHYPTNGRELGREAALGDGQVDFKQLFTKLKSLNFAGPVTIEREISGEQQVADIRKAMAVLEPLL